ncbi:unnamed protein product [Allacma fusca]|uniref:Uncharacterized protein n=1 Tax=Allacma fusca TaxID=39272 RepID=A0A8J2J7A0_9HEXA|nr:unnamed protein product [Allacma fusca]
MVSKIRASHLFIFFLLTVLLIHSSIACLDTDAPCNKKSFCCSAYCKIADGDTVGVCRWPQNIPLRIFRR